VATIGSYLPGFFSAYDYGVRADGATQSDAYLANAIAAATASSNLGGIVELPVGTGAILLGATVSVPPNVGLLLPYGCLVQPYSGFTGELFAYTASATPVYYIGFLGPGVIDGNLAAARGIHLKNVVGARIEPVVRNCTGDGVYLDGCQDVVIFATRLVNNGTGGTGYGINEATTAANFYVGVDVSGNASGGVGFVNGSQSRFLDRSTLVGNPLAISPASGGPGGIPQVSPSGQLVTSGQLFFDQAKYLLGIHTVTPDTALQILGGGAHVSRLATPSLPTIVITGGGTGNQSYVVIALDGNGNPTLPSPVASTYGAGPTSLDGSHYNTISWASVPGAVYYYVIRIVGTTYINIAPTNFNGTTLADTGQAGTLYTLPTANGTAALTVDNRLGIGTSQTPDTSLQVLGGGQHVAATASPGQPTVSPGATGSASWSYYVVARDALGNPTSRAPSAGPPPAPPRPTPAAAMTSPWAGRRSPARRATT
jgi:hypothetical protein